MVREFLLGNISIDTLPVGLVMAPMYGGGAVLVREFARRLRKGWPTMFLQALVYGVGTRRVPVRESLRGHSGERASTTIWSVSCVRGRRSKPPQTS
jgi:hypothetical protein